MFSERLVGHAQCLPERVGVSASPGRDDLHFHLLDKRSALQLHYTCTAYAWCHLGLPGVMTVWDPTARPQREGPLTSTD